MGRRRERERIVEGSVLMSEGERERERERERESTKERETETERIA